MNKRISAERDKPGFDPYNKSDAIRKIEKKRGAKQVSNIKKAFSSDEPKAPKKEAPKKVSPKKVALGNVAGKAKDAPKDAPKDKPQSRLKRLGGAIMKNLGQAANSVDNDGNRVVQKDNTDYSKKRKNRKNKESALMDKLKV